MESVSQMMNLRTKVKGRVRTQHKLPMRPKRPQRMAKNSPTRNTNMSSMKFSISVLQFLDA